MPPWQAPRPSNPSSPPRRSSSTSSAPGWPRAPSPSCIDVVALADHRGRAAASSCPSWRRGDARRHGRRRGRASCRASVWSSPGSAGSRRCGTGARRARRRWACGWSAPTARPMRFQQAFLRAAVGIVDFFLIPIGFVAVVVGAAVAARPAARRHGRRHARRPRALGRRRVAPAWFRPAVRAGSSTRPRSTSPPSTTTSTGSSAPTCCGCRELTAGARDHLAVRIANPVAVRIGHTPPPNVHPHAFLECVAARVAALRRAEPLRRTAGTAAPPAVPEPARRALRGPAPPDGGLAAGRPPLVAPSIGDGGTCAVGANGCETRPGARCDLTYLDHAATTPLRPEARAAMLPWLGERFGNPSGRPPGGPGRPPGDRRGPRRRRRGRRAAGPARSSSPAAAPRPTTWRSPASTAPGPARCCAAPSSTRPCCEPGRPGRRARPSRSTPTASSTSTPSPRLLTPDTTLVSVMVANNEVGVVQPVAEVAELVHAAGARRRRPRRRGAGRRLARPARAAWPAPTWSASAPTRWAARRASARWSPGAARRCGPLAARRRPGARAAQRHPRRRRHRRLRRRPRRRGRAPATPPPPRVDGPGATGWPTGLLAAIPGLVETGVPAPHRPPARHPPRLPSRASRARRCCSCSTRRACAPRPPRPAPAAPSRRRTCWRPWASRPTRGRGRAAPLASAGPPPTPTSTAPSTSSRRPSPACGGRRREGARGHVGRGRLVGGRRPPARRRARGGGRDHEAVGRRVRHRVLLGQRRRRRPPGGPAARRRRTTSGTSATTSRPTSSAPYVDAHRRGRHAQPVHRVQPPPQVRPPAAAGPRPWGSTPWPPATTPASSTRPDGTRRLARGADRGQGPELRALRARPGASWPARCCRSAT